MPLTLPKESARALNEASSHLLAHDTSPLTHVQTGETERATDQSHFGFSYRYVPSLHQLPWLILTHTSDFVFAQSN